MLSETFGGYPAGFDKSNFAFITPYQSDRKKWLSLVGVNLVDGESYQIAMQPTPNQDKVIPESFRILLRNYLGKPEVKSLAPDGMPCTERLAAFCKEQELQRASLFLSVKKRIGVGSRAKIRA